MSIRLIEEDPQLQTAFGIYEFCYFGCGKRTKFWHIPTNQPVCKECGKTHKTSELVKSHPKYNHKKIKL